ncbi:MAG: ATP-dependent helicase [Thermoplasmataceae archaeon]
MSHYQIKTTENDLESVGVEKILPFLDPVISSWFNSKYSELTEPQRKVIPLIHSKENVLVSSPTGTGKTLTGFLAIINELFGLARKGELLDNIYCVYISPLKALANDIDRNLKQPLSEIYEIANELEESLSPIRVGVRSGDTTQSDRQKMLRKPPHIIITTPESLSLSLSAPKFREKFSTVKYVIVDEIHEISSSKRGTLLSLNLERLELLSPNFVRIGLSATQAPLDVISNFLCGMSEDKPRPCNIIDVDIKRDLELTTITPVEDLTLSNPEVANERMYDILAKLIEEHKTTLIFTNTRSGTEHVAVRLKARGIESIEAHHSSLGKETRLSVEDKLKKGELKCVISSTSLELGIDIGSIDLVVQIGSPKSVSKGLQRIGRSGHSIRELSKGRFVVFNLDDLVECAVLTRAAYEKEIDKVKVPENALDVLSQAIIGISLEKTWGIEESFKLIRSAYPYRNLTMEDYMDVLHYLSGRVADSTIYSKIWLDEETKVFGKKKSTRMIYFMNIGTIPDEADYKVIDQTGRNLGQLSDKFVEKMKPGDIFVLGARTYAFIKARGNRIIVRDATGLKPTIPSWSGEMLPRSYDLGVLIGKFRKEVQGMLDNDSEARKWLEENYRVDRNGSRSILSYIRSQEKFGLPSDDFLLIEGNVEKGLYSALFLVPLGRRVNDALSRAYALAISTKFGTNTRITVTDDGFMLTYEQKIDLKQIVSMINTENFEEMVRKSVSNTEIFKQRFRHCASRSMMVLRRYKGHEISVVRQQLRSEKVLRALQEIPGFPVITETFREIMNDMMDVPMALKYVGDVIEKGKFRINNYSDEASPFSLSLVLAGVSDIVMMEDRARLLRELQSRIVDKIYNAEKKDFIIRDPRIVENYFVSKVPKINSYEDFEKFATYFPFFDIMRNRFNSPFPYGKENILEFSERALSEGKIISVHIRSTFWTSFEKYSLFKDLFSNGKLPVGEEADIIDLCENRTFKELKELSVIPEDRLRSILLNLESAYMIHRSLLNGNQTYAKKTDPIGESYTFNELIRNFLSTMGPMTFDEISVKIPVDQNRLREELESMVKSGEAVKDYITPVFADQYIMKSDLEALLGFKDSNPEKNRISRLSEPVKDLSEYMDKFGFFTDPMWVKSRAVNFNTNDIIELEKNGRILTGRFFKHKNTWISDKFASILRALRKRELNDNEIKILQFLKYGAVTLQGISSALGEDLQVIREQIRSMEYLVEVGNKNGLYYALPHGKEISRKESIEEITRMFGPITVREIMQFFWVDLSHDELSGIPSIYYNRAIYYGNDSPQPERAIITTSDDLITIYTGKQYVDDSGINALFYDGGQLCISMEMDHTRDTVWIETLIVEREDKINDFISTLKEFASRNLASAIIFLKFPEKFIDNLKSAGFIISGENAIYGDGEFVDTFYNNLLDSAYKHYGGYRSISKSVLERINTAFLGFRDPIEAHYAGIRESELESYFISDLIFNFNGPFGMVAKATPEIISIYRSLRKTPLEGNMTKILKIIMEDPADEREISQLTGIDISHVKEIVKELFSRCIIAKDHSGNFRFIVERFEKDECVRIIIREIVNAVGFISKEIYLEVTQDPNTGIFTEEIKKMLKSGFLKKTYIKDRREPFYFTTINTHDTKINSSTLKIVSYKDFLYLCFRDFIKSNLGGAKTFLVGKDGNILGSVSFRKTGRRFEIKEIIGIILNRDEIKRELSLLGYTVVF